MAKAISDIMPEGFDNKTLVTDCWAAYFKGNKTSHQLCTAHLLRELKLFTQKYPENDWAPKLSELITQALRLRKENQATPEKSSEINQTFSQLLTETIPQKIKELKTFQNRMVKYASYVFPFLDNPDIPPDNNSSERAIRTFKVKQKVSNFFKSTEGSDSYAVIRSVIDTAIKNNQNPFVAIKLIAILPVTE